MFTPPKPSSTPVMPEPAHSLGLTIIIPVYNGLHYTKACLESLRRHTPDDLYTLEIVDNGSTDGTAEWLASQPHITVHRMEKNLGFVAANNVVLDRLQHQKRDVLLLNNDTEILHDGWLEHMLGVAYSASDIGIVGCLQLGPDGLVHHAGTYMPTHTWNGWTLGAHQEDVGQFYGAKDVEGVQGSCMLIRRDVLSQLGGLYTGYTSYYEDTDYCLRCLKHGYRVVCDLDTRILHHEHVTTLENDMDFDAIYEGSRKKFRDRWESEILENMGPPLVWQSLVSQNSGYARSSREMVLRLDEKGIDVRLGNLFGTRFSDEISWDPRIEQLKERSLLNRLPQVVYGQGDLFYKNGGDYKIGYTMLETTGLPDEWVAQCNGMDEIWVPSTFNQQTFQESGVTRPIHVIPLGVCAEDYHPGLRAERFSERFTFLSVFEWGERKNPASTLRAFCRAFGPEDDVALVMKYSVGIPFDLRQWLFDLNLPAHTPPMVFLQSANIAHEQMGSFYQGADCYVSSSHGEGWGMPMLEAMACGLPTVATNWSAQTMFMHEKNSYPIPVKDMIPAKAICPYYEGFHWAQIDEDALAERLRHIYRNPSEAKRLGLAAAKEVHSKWSWEQAADHIIKRLEKIGV